jgi:hypothetical protein
VDLHGDHHGEDDNHDQQPEDRLDGGCEGDRDQDIEGQEQPRGQHDAEHRAADKAAPVAPAELVEPGLHHASPGEAVPPGTNEAAATETRPPIAGWTEEAALTSRPSPSGVGVVVPAARAITSPRAPRPAGPSDGPATTASVASRGRPPGAPGRPPPRQRKQQPQLEADVQPRPELLLVRVTRAGGATRWVTATAAAIEQATEEYKAERATSRS